MSLQWTERDTEMYDDLYLAWLTREAPKPKVDHNLRNWFLLVGVLTTLLYGLVQWVTKP